MDKEFIRVGYYVNNDYPDEETRLDPPQTPDLSRLQRNVLADKPRVTRFSIPWYLFLTPGTCPKSRPPISKKTSSSKPTSNHSHQNSLQTPKSLLLLKWISKYNYLTLPFKWISKYNYFLIEITSRFKSL